MASEYSLSDVLESIYYNQLALEAAVMRENVRRALQIMGINAGFINLGVARLRGLELM